MFEVITSPKDIKKYNRRLGERLKEAFPLEESRKITYPAGWHTGKVYFEESAQGGKSRGWSPAKIHNGKYRNFMLFGTPNSQQGLEIAVQLNFPAENFNRSPAGAFVRDTKGDIYLAHRGKLTRGNAGLKIDLVLSHFTSTISATDDKKTSQLILISGLEAPDMVDNLFRFAKNAREVADLVSSMRNAQPNEGYEDEVEKQLGVKTSQPKNQTKEGNFSRLTEYFSEFSGESKYSRHPVTGSRVVSHGAVVDALEKYLNGKGKAQKNQAIDLALIEEKQVAIFEVKTSTSTTDVYTAVGQLLLHGESLAELLALPVKRYLVVPELPKVSFIKYIEKALEAKVVTYKKVAKGYTFEGI